MGFVASIGLRKEKRCRLPTYLARNAGGWEADIVFETTIDTQKVKKCARVGGAKARSLGE
jgi:hypothetical protein